MICALFAVTGFFLIISSAASCGSLLPPSTQPSRSAIAEPRQVMVLFLPSPSLVSCWPVIGSKFSFQSEVSPLFAQPLRLDTPNLRTEHLSNLYLLAQRSSRRMDLLYPCVYTTPDTCMIYVSHLQHTD